MFYKIMSDGIRPFAHDNLFSSKGSSKCRACLTITNFIFVACYCKNHKQNTKLCDI
jgi:hypothetical protein